MILGQLEFTKLNLAAIKGYDSPNPFTIMGLVWSRREVVLKFTSNGLVGSKDGK